MRRQVCPLAAASENRARKSGSESAPPLSRPVLSVTGSKPFILAVNDWGFIISVPVSVVVGAMGEKTPNADESGIERRNVLKGLGFGAMTIAGVGAMTGNVAAVGNVVNAGFTPPDEDLEDDEVTGNPLPTLDPAKTDSTYDIVLKTNMGEPDGKRIVGKSWTVLSRDPMQVTSEVFEEGTADSSTEEVMADTDGMMEIRQNFSVEDLPSGNYVLVLSGVDYTGLAEASPVSDGVMKGTYQFDTCSQDAPGSGAIVAHGFSVP